MKVVGYIRVSTKGQADEGLGLEIQEASIRQWAKDSGHRIAAMFADAGISGAKELDNRPGLADALAAVKQGDGVGLVVYRLDRLARDLIIQETLLAEVKRAGGTMC